jgi:hypothetical protein
MELVMELKNRGPSAESRYSGLTGCEGHQGTGPAGTRGLSPGQTAEGRNWLVTSSRVEFENGVRFATTHPKRLHGTAVFNDRTNPVTEQTCQSRGRLQAQDINNLCRPHIKIHIDINNIFLYLFEHLALTLKILRFITDGRFGDWLCVRLKVKWYIYFGTS